ncbi:MAG: sugar transferase, partial [Alphaproteobacteria bacterium]
GFFSSGLIADTEYFGKRALDFCGAIGGLAVFAVPMIIIALMIKLSGPGPIIFSQRRFGRDGRPFAVYKFRTMRQKGPRTAKNLQISRLGHFLRRASLDELPQLYNVLCGEMSLVGPRPHEVDMRVEGELYGKMVANYHIRHAVRPGITGLAQISGCRGEVASFAQAKNRVDLDLDYIARRSLRLDVAILAMTVRHEFLLGNGS